MLSLFMPRWLSALLPSNQNNEPIDHSQFIWDVSAGISPPKGLDATERKPMTRTSSPSPQNDAPSKQNSRHTLLDVLPLEIRQQIWTDVLGSNVFHLDIQLGRLRGLRCVASDPSTCQHGHAGCRLRLSRTRQNQEKNTLLPTLLACKQM